MVESIEAAIRSGGLAPGALLPPVRALADTLELSPTTVAAAYRTLRNRGLLVTQGRRGTRVSARPPIVAAPAAPLPEGVRDLGTGNPDPLLLPRLGPALRRLDPEPRLYGEELAHPELMRLAAERFARDGLPTARVAVAGGALDAIERVFLAHLRPGDRVAIEDPGFTGVLDLLAALGLEALPVELDDAGPRPESLEAALHAGARALVVTPRAQNPTGAAIDPERGSQLRDVLRADPELLLIEDDHMAELAGADYVTLWEEGRSRFAAVRSVSKTLGPDLRVALVACDETTWGRVEGRQLIGIRWVSFVLQELVVALWRDRDVARQLNEAASAYRARREAFLAALAERGIPAHGRSGHNVWIPVADETRTVGALQEAGWAVSAGRRFRQDSGPAIRVTTAELEPEAGERVAEALAEVLAPSRRTLPA